MLDFPVTMATPTDDPSLLATVAAVRGTPGLPGVHVAPAAVVVTASLRRLVDEGGLAAWKASVLGRDAGGDPGVAAAFTAIYLVDGIVLPLVTAVLRTGRGWRLGLDTVAVERHAEAGFVVELVIADTPGVLVTGPPADVQRVVAHDVATVLQPLLAVVHDGAPYGLRGIWGHVADEVLSFAVTDARNRGADIDRAWADASVIVATIAEEVPALANRPHRQAVPWRGDDADLVVRGTCCLLYKVAGPGSWCTSCPLRPAEERAERFARWLDSTVRPPPAP